MHVSALSLYPVKSAPGTDVRSAVVRPWGLEHDRRWMVVDDRGRRLSPLGAPGLRQVTAVPRPDGGLTLTRAGTEALEVPPPVHGELVAVAVSRLEQARSAGRAADAWLTAALGRPIRLVWLDDPRRRSVSAEHGGQPGDVLSLADAGPLLLTSTASLARLDQWVAQTWAERYAACGAAAGTRPQPLAMARFRPNLVVDGDLPPFAEDRWSTVRVGDVHFRVSELCDRCGVTTIDPVTGRRGSEPLRSLSVHRQWDDKVWFGVRLVPTTTGSVSVGDPVTAR